MIKMIMLFHNINDLEEVCCVCVRDLTQVCISIGEENSLIKVSVEVRIVLQGAVSSPLSQIDQRAMMQCLDLTPT